MDRSEPTETHQQLRAEIRSMMSDGNKIAAVKHYQEATGVGLAEAKAAVEQMGSEAGPTARGEWQDEQLVQEVLQLLRQRGKIEAVKLFRERTGMSLMESKTAVEKLAEMHGVHGASGGGCLGVLFLCLTVLGVFGLSWTLIA